MTTSTVGAIDAKARDSTSVVIDQSVYNAATWVEPNVASVYFVHDLRPRAHYDAALEALLACASPKLFALYFDLHDVKNRTLIDRLAGRVDAVSWMFEKRPVPAGAVEERYRDTWLKDASDILDLWNVVVRSFPCRIEMPFALGQSEFVAAAPGHVWDVSVAGAPYRTRMLAQRAIRDARLSVAPYRGSSRVATVIGRVLDGTLPAERASLTKISMLQRLQRSLVRSTPVSFVCGSGLLFPVRKFFEAPAMRNALVAYPCIGFEDLGFRDGEHAIAVAPEDAGRAARQILGDSALCDRLTTAAFELVAREHSVGTRAAQLVECMRRLERGKLTGAQFVQGRFEIV